MKNLMSKERKLGLLRVTFDLFGEIREFYYVNETGGRIYS